MLFPQSPQMVYTLLSTLWPWSAAPLGGTYVSVPLMFEMNVSVALEALTGESNVGAGRDRGLEMHLLRSIEGCETGFGPQLQVKIAVLPWKKHPVQVSAMWGFASELSVKGGPVSKWQKKTWQARERADQPGGVGEAEVAAGVHEGLRMNGACHERQQENEVEMHGEEGERKGYLMLYGFQWWRGSREEEREER
jgi:hypothetical protein